VHTVPGSIDWFGTLLRSPRPSARELRRRPRSVPAQRLWLIVLDCSSSMLRSGGLALAKGVAGAVTEQARSAGARVALISFAGSTAQARLAQRADGITRAISELGGGGGTPLRSALQQALAVCRSPLHRPHTVVKRLVLLTDGRTRESVLDLRAGCRGLSLRVVDCERGPLRLGLARKLAAGLGAEYLHVDELRAGAE
jgi:magnesium chelatase subunit ChlD-like protein